MFTKGIPRITTVYFSKDRPMQLDLCLKTNFRYSLDWDIQEEVVIYKATNENFKNTYETLKIDYPFVCFVEETNFKENLLKIIRDSNYILFVVDDCVFTHKYSLVNIMDILEKEEMEDVLGFSLRLGENTTYCYPVNKNNEMPEMQREDGNKSIFDWTKVKIGDFGYPLEVSSSIYKTKNIIELLDFADYNNPNTLEWSMYCNLRNFECMPRLMCYQISVAFCNPLNVVQKQNTNKAGRNPEYGINSLLKKYEERHRINSELFYNFVSNGCHQEVNIEFVSEKKEIWNIL